MPNHTFTSTDYQLTRTKFILSDGWKLPPLLIFEDGVDASAAGKKRINSVKFHLRMDDYFATLATVLELISRKSCPAERRQNILLEIKKDLLFLQNNYKIAKKKNPLAK